MIPGSVLSNHSLLVGLWGPYRVSTIEYGSPLGKVASYPLSSLWLFSQAFLIQEWIIYFSFHLPKTDKLLQFCYWLSDSLYIYIYIYSLTYKASLYFFFISTQSMVISFFPNILFLKRSSSLYSTPHGIIQIFSSYSQTNTCTFYMFFIL